MLLRLLRPRFEQRAHMSTLTKLNYGDPNEVTERENKMKRMRDYTNLYDMFVYKRKPDNEILKRIKDNNIDINDLTCSHISGVYQPGFFAMIRRPRILHHFLDTKKIDKNRIVDLDWRNPYYVDFLEVCDISDIKKAKDYGFKLTGKNLLNSGSVSHDDYCGKYLNADNFNRAIKFIEYGILTNNDLINCMTKAKFISAIEQTHNSIIKDLKWYEEVRVEEHEQKLLDIIEFYKQNNKSECLDVDASFFNGMYGKVSWTLDLALKKVYLLKYS